MLVSVFRIFSGTRGFRWTG